MLPTGLTQVVQQPAASLEIPSCTSRLIFTDLMQFYKAARGLL